MGAVKAPVIAVVGPSGVGKDSLMRALAEADPSLCLMQRVITRDPEAGGEDYVPVTEARFAGMVEQGAFALHWQAHGLSYGIPARIEELREGSSGVLVNFSRSVLLQAQELFGDFVVLSVTATPEVLAARLAARGREDAATQARRLSQAGKALPEGLHRVVRIDNSGPLTDAVETALAALHPVSA
ncbi:MAG: phosphonate metabolism protein/1,5-bisphosphokinase (PRPP-forming) PhnN [Rhodobacteraceae bacterium]|nr:phosphonate metabolism protein/1,5-bisphosphokinase (PRPP-forming) PhnN [Paracoccaceae bacterium]